MKLLWLWIVLGILVIYFLSLVIFGFALGRLGFLRKSAWNRDNKAWIPNYPTKELMDRCFASMDYYHNHGKDVFITSFDGLKLYGKYFEVNNAKRTVILAHGYRGKPEGDFAIISDWLRELNDTNILFITMRAHGRSEGDFITMGVNESKDIQSWVNFVTKLNDLPIYLWGLSMGTASILLSLKDGYGDNVKGIIADCGFNNPYTQMVDIIDQHTFRFIAKIIMVFSNIYVKTKLKISLKKYDAKEYLKNNTIPILFVHGEKDNVVIAKMSKESYNLNKGDKDLLLSNKSTHMRSFIDCSDEYKKKVLDLFIK